jgi:hypothetical protein
MEDDSDTAIDGHFGPPLSETVISDWTKFGILEKVIPLS